MSNPVKLLIVLAAFFISEILLRHTNLKRDIRGRQVLMIYLSPVIAVAEVVAAYIFYEKIVFEEGSELYGAEVFTWNVLLIALFLVVKLIVLPFLSKFWQENSRMEMLGDQWYCYDSDEDNWFLREDCVNMRKLFDVFSWSATAIAAIVVVLGWILGSASIWWLKVFPIAAVIVITEISNFLSGYTKPEFIHDVSGDGIGSVRMGAYFKLRKIYETMFPSAVLVSHTGNEYSGKQGATELLNDLSKSDDSIEKIVGNYFLHLKKKDGFFDVDMISATNTLLHGKSTVIFNPFYRDLSDYVLLPMVDKLINNKKCLIIVGRSSLCDDVSKWAEEILKKYSRTRSLWRVSTLSKDDPECEVGILSFSQIYDLNVIHANAEFVREAGLVILIEPSKMMTTSQSGLSILVEGFDKEFPPTYCICDHDMDGLVDTLSHVLQTNLTDVVAAPVPRSVYTGIGWSASGDYKRQILFDKQTHYLGNGIEIAAVALKNQVPHVTWYSAEKAPVEDIGWLAGQYYAQICKYAHLPSQQRCLEERISFSSNLWGSEIKNEEFVIAEDEFCNMFATMRAYLTRGTDQSFVNIISENYLLRDYMRYNRQLFMADPKAIPAIAPNYSKTERNTVLRLILMMACKPVDESYIAHELSILGYETDDVYTTLSGLIKFYTHIEDVIVTVQNKQVLNQDLIPEQICCYSIARHIFDDCFSDTLKNAFFVVEDEKFGKEYIDARLFEHITQLVMPGQFLTHNGKLYKVHAVSPQIGCILHRAADSYRERQYYRQLRNYRFENEGELLTTKKIMDIEITMERRNFSVSAEGYLQMLDNHDLRSARVVDLSADPNVGIYSRSYKNKTVLKIALPDTDETVRFTICMLLNEVFRSVFPDAWPYIAVLSARPEGIDGMFNYINYGISGEYDKEMIYVVEDSDMDLGLLEAVDNHFMRFFEIICDYLEWHFEKMREPAYKDPVPAEVELPPEEEIQKKSFIARLVSGLRRVLTDEMEEAKPVDDTVKEEEAEEEKQDIEIQVENPESEETEFITEVTETEEQAETLEEVEEETAELSETFEINEEESKSEEGKSELEEIKESDDETELISDLSQDMIPGEEIVLHTDGEDLLAIEGISDDLDILMDHISPITPSRYQQECFLKFGFNEIDERLSIETVKSYLAVRGWSNNSLTKARKRSEGEKTFLDLNAENVCDFCGIPLSGVSYERLADGRTRCNECSLSAINDVEGFRELYRKTEALMENIFDINLRVSIIVKTADARTIARRTGQVFKPSTGFTPRVLGFAQRKGGRYTLFVENGSPRLASIDTITHELTHIWQYLNWNDSEIYRLYGKGTNRDIVYEGMAMWAAIQMLYVIGETEYAELQERLAERRTDVYGIGFRLYREKYGFAKNGDNPSISPFLTFPPL